MRFGRAVLVWLLLLALLAIEFGLSRMGTVGQAVPLVGMAMAVIVAMTFMRLGNARGLPTVFALAGMFWLAVLFGLGSLDPLTRHDVPVAADRTARP